MELKLKPYNLPDKISFNFEELKQELTEKVSLYETLVYTDEQIQDAKKDKANLNKLKKALNDERIRLEKEYMIPFNEFKKEINEIINIIDKPVLLIDKQVKEYEEKQKQDKLEKIKDYFNSIEKPELHWLGLPAIYDQRWLNASVSMKSIQEEISSRLERIKNDLTTLQNLPEFGFEASEVYKTTLDVNKAINEAQRMSEIAKAKAEQERLAAEAEFAQHMNPPVEETVVGHVDVVTKTPDGEEHKVGTFDVEVPTKQWISFKALLSIEDALALKGFFNSRNIEFESI